MKRPVREGDLDWTTWYSGTSREIRGKALCDVGGAAKVGVGLLELAPGSDTTPAHYHTHEEEHLYVLAGQLTLVLGEERFLLEPGAYVCFPAGQAVKHHLRNETAEPARYLMIGERISADRVVYD
jgi:uncharacterized cupin superfamily protein